jgi:hypothetical protein
MLCLDVKFVPGIAEEVSEKSLTKQHFFEREHLQKDQLLAATTFHYLTDFLPV